MGNVLFCPQLHQAGIDCVSGAAVGAGFLFHSHVPLLETYNLEKPHQEEEPLCLKPPKVRFTLPPVRKNLYQYGFEYRFTEPAEDSNAKKSKEGDPPPCEFNFSTRLYHLESDTMITQDNHVKFGLRGKFFDEVSRCCQNVVQKELQDVFGYDIVTIPTLSKPSVEGVVGAVGGDATPPIQAFVSPDLAATLSSNDAAQSPEDLADDDEKPILLIIPGKGKSRAGVLSAKQLVVSGVESGSAMYHILQAAEQEMSVILLDPNAWGESRGMEVMNHSLSYLFGAESAADGATTTLPAAIGLSKRPLHILAHSAGGGYLTTYLSQGVARETLLRQIRKIAFTDSTHNLQWYKEQPELWNFLQDGSKCLYVRNNSAHRTFGSHRDKAPGEVHEGDHWWHHRFGSIPTVWAGTSEHSLVCWIAKEVIWNFFRREA